jgi:DNA replication and repair protein RecF
MIFTHLQGSNLRCLTEFELTPITGVNLLIGDNGAGKTSVIEAIHLLGYGRSFRSRIRDGLIKYGNDQLTISARWLDSNQNPHQAGIQHNGNTWQARLDNENINQLSQFCAQFPVLSFEPGSHELITGSSEVRRRFIDWALFHVEPSFFSQWRRFNRALKQRNALLKTNPSDQDLQAWDEEFAETGELIAQYRKNYLESLLLQLNPIVQAFLPECGSLQLNYNPGWRKEHLSLLDVLRINRDRDKQAGFSTSGPHRADWLPIFNQYLSREHFSRGQAKLIALSCLLAQAQHFQREKNTWPVLCFDDLASELDEKHLKKVLTLLVNTKAQIWITGTEILPIYTKLFEMLKVFHVEQGQVSETIIDG